MTLTTKRGEPSLKVQVEEQSVKCHHQGLGYVSPLSQQKCKLYAHYQRTSSLRKLAKYELDDEQNAEMSSIVEATQPDELEKLFKEGNQHGVGDVMKSIWLTDKNRLSLAMIKRATVS